MARKFIPWVYDLVLWTLSLLIDFFFREVKTRGSYKVPRRDPIIFVAAPHANQFVDPLLLMRQVRLEAGRRISFLIAEKSMRRKFIGSVASAVGGISVSRAQDLQVKGDGVVLLEDRREPLRLTGIGTKFLSAAKPGSLIVLPGETTGSAEVASVESDTSLTLKREFKGLKALELLSAERGTAYKLAPKVDQSEVYTQVFNRLDQGGCVGIFPEGGSHDRTELLPLKAGVAIMALGALIKNPDCNLKIVPCGMNYFHAHRFRSRAVIEFGTPLEVPKELVEMYKKSDTKREATKLLLDMIYDALASVTVQTADYETLMVIQAARRLYKPAHKKLPLQSIVELNRRFITAYNHFRDDPRIVKLRQDVMQYNRDLYSMGIRDHQLTNLKLNRFTVLAKLIYRSLKLLVLALGSLPGVLLFGPVFVATKLVALKKAREALAGSSVKIQARDVLATWKLLVAMVFTPLLYTFYAVLGTWIVFRYQLGPDYVRQTWALWTIPAMTLVLLPMVTYSALRFGEIGMDIYKSLTPLLLAVTNVDILDELQDRREALSEELVYLINTLGPEIFPDFDSTRIVALPDHMIEPPSPTYRRRPSSAHGGLEFPTLNTGGTPSSGTNTPGIDKSLSSPDGHYSHLLSNPFFSTAPPSRRSHSRRQSVNGGLSSVQMSSLANDEGSPDFNAVSAKIRETMTERSQRRRSDRSTTRSSSLYAQENASEDQKLTAAGDGSSDLRDCLIPSTIRGLLLDDACKCAQPSTSQVLLALDDGAADTSQELLVKTVDLSIQCISYLRGIFDEDMFFDDHLNLASGHASKSAAAGPRNGEANQQRIMRLKRQRSRAADDLLDCVEYGVKDALQKGHLAALMFNISLKTSDHTQLYESYTFRFWYKKEKQVVGMSLHSSSTGSISGSTVQGSAAVLQQLCRQLILTTQSLEPMPDDLERTLSFKLFFNESTPRSYQPPGFRTASSSEHARMVTASRDHAPLDQLVGLADLRHHRCCIHLTTLSDLPNSSKPVSPSIGQVWDAEIHAQAPSVMGNSHSDNDINLPQFGDLSVQDQDVNPKRVATSDDEQLRFENLLRASPDDIVEPTQPVESVLPQYNRISRNTQVGKLRAQGSSARRSRHTKSEIDCACGDNQEDGAMVQCYECKSWAHLPCYGYLRDPPEEYQHICYECAFDDKPVVLLRMQDLALYRHVLWNLWDGCATFPSTRAFAAFFQCDLQTAHSLVRKLHTDNWLEPGNGPAQAKNFKRRTSKEKQMQPKFTVVKTISNERRLGKLFDPQFGIEDNSPARLSEIRVRDKSASCSSAVSEPEQSKSTVKRQPAGTDGRVGGSKRRCIGDQMV
ncbi:HORMA domain-domain-containing protein [Protomyces lactucae-debilis]|uniref:HORMA domain-domain-containing protein n=1 Tax=Protomyces lactucae-debilis TaxID=2754530 RepID=A0A1Y2FHA9_PROLT|nr:HORMA domain-containing protein [Protomyces lactucae-debilis]ORY83313.1 HORMA domain-domain-containing protein [Protomyces lactucae-debilis]